MFNLMARYDKSCSTFFGIILCEILVNVQFILHKPCMKK